jgi:DSF synthase
MKPSTQLIDFASGGAPAAPRAAIAEVTERLKVLVGGPEIDRLETGALEEMTVDYDRDQKIVWCDFNFAGRPSFTQAVFRDIGRVGKMLRQIHAASDAHEQPVRYVVLGSHMPGVWNLGGDLELFQRLIRSRDRDGLLRYTQQACEAGYNFTTGFGLPLITVSLVQGDALGGGFEAVLSSNLIVAERSARFGLPEVLFNLFPGMGAYTFLARRIAPGMAERMIMSGSTWTAAQLYEMGIVDILAEDGHGRAALEDHIARNERRHAAQRAVYQSRHIVNPVRLEEMLAIGDLWVDAALTLGEPDLKRMARLIAAQDRRRTRVDL